MWNILEHVNKFLCGDCVEVMKSMPNDCIDMIMTSPPYNYRDFSLDFSLIGKEFFRILKDGGIAAVVIQDQTECCVKKTLTSFRMVLDWCDSIGFKLFECMIYKRLGASVAIDVKRFRLDHEYVMLFLKGSKPMCFRSKSVKVLSGKCTNDIDKGFLKNDESYLYESRGTVWSCELDKSESKLKHLHPATYPDKLPYDLIECFCPLNGIVLDPFIGSGTTALAAKALNCNYIGIDISQEFVNLCNKRIVNDYELYKKQVDVWSSK